MIQEPLPYQVAAPDGLIANGVLAGAGLQVLDHDCDLV